MFPASVQEGHAPNPEVVHTATYEHQRHVLEVGCADAFGTRIVQQAVGKVSAIDFDPVFIADVKERMDPDWSLEVFVHDMLAGPVSGPFDAAYALDTLEHIAETDEDRFINNIMMSLTETGIAIL